MTAPVWGSELQPPQAGSPAPPADDPRGAWISAAIVAAFVLTPYLVLALVGSRLNGYTEGPIPGPLLIWLGNVGLGSLLFVMVIGLRALWPARRRQAVLIAVLAALAYLAGPLLFWTWLWMDDAGYFVYRMLGNVLSLALAALVPLAWGLARRWGRAWMWTVLAGPVLMGVLGALGSLASDLAVPETGVLWWVGVVLADDVLPWVLAGLLGWAIDRGEIARARAASSASPSVTDAPGGPVTAPPQPSRRLIALELVIVLGLGLGRSAYYSLLSLIDKLTRPEALDAQTTTMNSSVVPDRPWLDLAYQLGSIVFPLFQVLLVLYLLHLAHGRARRSMGFDLRRPGRDLLTGVGWTLLIGIPGIVLYLAARQAGLNTEVAPANLAETWWTVPAYVALAAMNGIVEEVVMLGYLLTRARDLRWSPAAAVGFSAVIRGAYHLYQGFGGFVGNLLMGLIFGAAYQRWGRVMPFVIAHTLLDVAAFVGYALLSPHLSWL